MMMGCSPSASLARYQSIRVAHHRLDLLGRCEVVHLAHPRQHVVRCLLVLAHGDWPHGAVPVRRFGGHLVGLLQEDLVEVANERLVECLVLSNRLLNRLHGIVVALDVQVVPHGLAASGKAVEDQRPRLAQGQTVPLDGVGVVVPLNPQLLLHAADGVRRQWTEVVQRGLQAVDLGDGVGCHYGLRSDEHILGEPTTDLGEVMLLGGARAATRLPGSVRYSPNSP